MTTSSTRQGTNARTRFAACAAGTLALCGAAWAGSPAPSGDANAPAQSQPAPSQPAGIDARAFASSFAGEWEGTVETVSAGGMKSTSSAFASVRRDASGRLDASVEHFAGGAWVNLGLALDPERRAALQGADQKRPLVLTRADDAQALRFAGAADNERVHTLRVSQGEHAGQVVLEWTTHDPRAPKDAQPTLVARYTLTRLPSGEASAAAEGFAQNERLAAARAALGGTAGNGAVAQVKE